MPWGELGVEKRDDDAETVWLIESEEFHFRLRLKAASASSMHLCARGRKSPGFAQGWSRTP